VIPGGAAARLVAEEQPEIKDKASTPERKEFVPWIPRIQRRAGPAQRVWRAGKQGVDSELVRVSNESFDMELRDVT
jgi:hypothetical protein